jgi:hypothetical protein
MISNKRSEEKPYTSYVDVYRPGVQGFSSPQITAHAVRRNDMIFKFHHLGIAMWGFLIR